MNAYQTRTAPSYGHDSTYSPFQGTGAPIFGYDSSANYITPISLEIRPRSVAKFLQFTGKERDSESGLDYFGARYYGSALGRFTSPDGPLADQDPSNPQSWNLYAYGRNNPLIGTDPDGHVWQVCESNGSNCATVNNDDDFDKYNQQTGNYVAGGKYYDSGGNQIGTASWSQNPDPIAGSSVEFVNRAFIGLGGNYAALLGPLAEGALNAGRLTTLGLEGAAETANATKLARLAGILKVAATLKGNFGLGSGTAEEAEELGRAWVGEGAETASDGKTLVSADGTRQYRPPSFKPNLGKVQANFESRPAGGGQWQTNGHLDVH